MWTTATRLFAPLTSVKLARIRYDLFFLKKGSLSVKEFVAKIQNMSALIAASGSRIFEEEKVETLLVGLTPEFDVVITLVSLSS